MFYLLAQVESDVKFMDDIEDEIKSDQEKLEDKEVGKPVISQSIVETKNELVKNAQGVM